MATRPGRPLVVGISVAFVGVIVLIYIWFRLNWPLWVLISLMLIGILIMILLIRAGYTAKWTGFGEETTEPKQHPKTLWDWLQLLAVLAIPVVVTFVSISFSIQQDASNQQQHQIDLKIAQDNRQNDMQLANDQQQEATLKSYLDDISDLLLNHNLRNSKPGDEMSQVARERTLTTLRRLQANRNRTVLQFLRDAHLIGIKRAVIDLSYANLSGDDLSGANLSDTDLSGSDLSGSDLSGANLSDADLRCLNQGGKKVCADVRGANLSGALLSGALLSGADLSCLNQSGKKVCAYMTGAFLSGAILSYANLSGANLSGANLSDAQLYDRAAGAVVSGAILSGADLSCANLSGAQVTTNQLALAKSLQGAFKPDGSIYGSPQSCL